MGLVYPHIDIKDTEEASLLQLDATDNTVLVPVPFVQRFYRPSDDFSVLNPIWDPNEERDVIPAKLYTDALAFIKEWSVGGGEWKVTVDSVTGEVTWIEPIEYSKGSDDNSTSPRYCFEYSIKLRSEKTPEGYPTYDVIYNYEKSYLMVVELLKRGLPVLVQPIPIKWSDYANVSNKSVMNADNTAGEYHIALSGADHDVVYNKYEGIAIVRRDYLVDKIDKVISGVEEGQKEGLLDKLVDKNLYPIKFITSGCYPNIGKLYEYTVSGQKEWYYGHMYSKLTELAKLRGDAISILELRENILSKEELRLALDDSDLPDLSTNFETYKLAAAFTPWCEFSIDKRLPTGRSAEFFNLTPLTTMPAGFAYLMAYAYSIQTNETWWAAAGVMRGQVPQMVRPLFEIGDSLMHLLQGMDAADNPEYNKMRLNPIMNTGSYGYRIWGNRMAAAFKDLAGVYKTMYSEFLNVRMLLCDIKKQIYAAAMRTTFEPNDDITWVSFKVLCSNLLDRMKSGRGLLWYKWHKEVSEERATIKARLTVRPIEAVEHFDITVFLTDQDAEVEE